MSNLSKLVQEVKALIKNEEPTVVMHTEDENIDVTFFVATEGEIAPGVKAEPDGTFTLSNGVKVTIENGEVVSLEAEVEVPDSVIEGQKNEEGEPSQEPAPQEPTELEKTKQALAEAQALIDELQAKIAESNSELEKKSTEIQQIESDLEEIKNFYSAVNKEVSERQESKPEQKGEGFKFKLK